MEFNPTIHESQPLFFIKTQQNLSISLSSPSPPSSSSGFNNFPILAIALLAIMVTAFLMVSYYIVVIKCCLNWQHFHPLRRFSFTRDRGPHLNESWMGFSSPATEIHRGLDELVLRDIPTFKYKTKGNNSNNSRSSSFSSSRGERSFRGCAVCLSEFEDQEMLRVLPHCGHIFHLDCIDIWLVNNANCPLCRSSISGVKRSSSPLDHIVAPSSSPQEIIPTSSNQDHDFVVIEIHSSRRRDEIKNERRKLYHHGSMMGDECINVRNKDEDFNVNQPMRRSFSMDSATDRQLLLQVQQIIRQNRHIRNESGSSSNGRSVRRSFLSFGQGQGSKSAILPIQSDL